MSKEEIIPQATVTTATLNADGGFDHTNFVKKATLNAAPKKAATKKAAFFDSDDDFSAPVSKPTQPAY